MAISEGPYSGQERPFLTRNWIVTLEGTDDITIPSNLRKIYGVKVGWHEAPDNDTYQPIAYVSGANVIVRCTHATVKKVSVKAIGTN